jgi:hypothetical protein
VQACSVEDSFCKHVVPRISVTRARPGDCTGVGCLSVYMSLVAGTRHGAA